MDSRLLSDRSSVFRHADPYAVSDYVNQHVGQHFIGLSKTTHPQASLNHRKLADLDLCRISYGGSVRVTSLALETVYHLQVLLQGNCLWRGHQREHHLVPGELLLINPDDPVDLTYSDDCEKFILNLPLRRGRLLTDALQRHAGRGGGSRPEEASVSSSRCQPGVQHAPVQFFPVRHAQYSRGVEAAQIAAQLIGHGPHRLRIVR